MGGALALLGEDENWEQFGDMTVEETTQFMRQMLINWYDAPCGDMTVDTPYWDTDEDVDDEMPADMQTWYGYVTDPASQPTELDFIEDATIWAFTGLIVLSLGLAGIAPALAFRTTSVKFVVAYKNAGNVGDIIRFFVDGYKIYEGVDTGDGSITNVPVLADPTLDEHQIYATAEAAA